MMDQTSSTRSTGEPKSGDSQQSWSPALQRLYLDSYEPFVRLASVLTGRRADGEEIVHDAFLAASTRTAEIDNLGAYVRRSVVNGAYGALRRRRSAERHLVDRPPDEAPAQLIEFRDVLMNLPWKQRAVIVLRFLEGLSVAQTAEIVGCRESTVRSHSRRGLHALRKELSP